MILDVSHGVTLGNIKHPSINKATDQMVASAQCPSTEHPDPQLLSKLDIKDRYWQMVIPEEEEWHFACVLPKATTDEPTCLVVRPFFLADGVVQQPCIFLCRIRNGGRHDRGTCSNTDQLSVGKPLKDRFLCLTKWPDGSIEQKLDKFVRRLVKVYMDDLIQLAATDHRPTSPYGSTQNIKLQKSQHHLWHVHNCLLLTSPHWQIHRPQQE
jgi:hypothetical protein